MHEMSMNIISGLTLPSLWYFVFYVFTAALPPNVPNNRNSLIFFQQTCIPIAIIIILQTEYKNSCAILCTFACPPSPIFSVENRTEQNYGQHSFSQQQQQRKTPAIKSKWKTFPVPKPMVWKFCKPVSLLKLLFFDIKTRKVCIFY